LQLPEQVNHFIVYLNDWGPAVFLVSDIDELLAAFMKTSIYLLVAGLIVNLLMRAVWVVMIGMSYAFPAGLSLEKFRFQRYFHDKMAALPSLEKQVIRLDRLCSVIYATTFLLFMCLVGAFFFIFVYGGAFLMLYHYWPNKSREVIEQLNALLNISIVFFALTYFLDFITLGWLKRFKWYAVLYRPIYVFMSLLTLAPLYRNIYYILIGHLNRWRVFAFCLAFVMLASLMVNVQRSRDNFFTDSVFGQRNSSLYTHEGYYRDKGASQMNRWMHIASAVVEEDLIEVFIPYKVALEDSMLSSYARKHQISLDSLLQKPALQLKALSNFYRL